MSPDHPFFSSLFPAQHISQTLTSLAVGTVFGTTVMGTVALFWSGTAIAQIRPDDSLGDERSRLTPGVQVRGDLADLIEGGARRGSNLFHSFEDFSVDDLQRVYFDNPEGIANILSRVTGSSRSDILGTLGVDGAANLFLINPNGVVFGPNAVLDVDGAFLTSTADNILFDDGYLFSATDPDAPPLVTVNIPIGVQFGPNPPASIINEAHLAAGGDLTLAAATVTNIGSLTAGGQVQITEAVPAQSETTIANPGVSATSPETTPNSAALTTTAIASHSATISSGAQLLSAPDDPFEISWASPVVTGIQPDTTLGDESSLWVEDVEIRGELGDRVDGGAIRGTHLFHSFTAFNVEEGDRTYFSNPTGVETILSRVTGPSRSDIMGTLGVDGSADLFMINPNGMIFGPNAALDIDGSFLASTGDRFTFGDGVEFRADDPNEAPTIAVNIPVGLQYGEPPARLISQAHLETGENLTLTASSVNSQGHLSTPLGEILVEGNIGDVQVQQLESSTATLHAGQDLQLIESMLETSSDLTLQANDTILIRDSETTPSITQSGGALLVQGNEAIDIFALNHANSGLVSGGDMVLRSVNPVGGDAHYQSGGNFRIENLNGNLGALTSPYDPVIRVSGNVQFDSYSGASLHILAGGSVTVSGNISITGTESVANSLQENDINVSLSDYSTTVNINGNSEPTLDIRAGTTAFGVVGINGETSGFIPDPPTLGVTPNGNTITIGSITNLSGADTGIGQVFLTNQYLPNTDVNGNITTGSIITYGDVVIHSQGDILTTGLIDTRSTQANQVTGDITLVSEGAITLGGNLLSGVGLNTTSNNPNPNPPNITGLSGDVTVLATGNVSIQDIISTSNSDGTLINPNSNRFFTTIRVESIDGNTILNGGKISGRNYNIGTFSSDIFVDAGNTIEISETDILSDGNFGRLFIGSHTTFDTSEPPINVEITNSSLTTNNNIIEGLMRAGNISIRGNTVGILGNSRISSNSSGSGTNVGGAGDITITGENIILDSLNQVYENSEVVIESDVIDGAGGMINITGNNSLIIRDDVSFSANTTGTGTGSDISIESPIIEISDATFSSDVIDGAGGMINITGNNSLIIRDDVSFFANTTGTGTGGDISIESPIIEISDATFGAETFHFINQSVQDNPNTVIDESEPDQPDQGGNAGNISIGTLTSNSIIRLSSTSIAARTHGFHGSADTPGNAGDISIGNETASVITLNNVDIAADGHAHLVRDRNADSSQDTYPGYSFDISYDAGNSGSITLLGNEVEVIDSDLNTTTYGSGIGGNVTIDGSDIEIQQSRIIVETSGATASADGGNILIGASSTFSNNSIIIEDSEVSANTGSTRATVHAQADPTNIHNGSGLDPEFGLADAGDVFIGNTTTNSIIIQNESSVQASSVTPNLDDINLAGNSGLILVSADGAVTINDSEVSNSSIDSLAGDVMFEGLDTLTINGGAIVSSTETGRAGTIQINAITSVAIEGDATDNNREGIFVEASDGIAGNVVINSGELSINNNAAISSSSTDGIAGSVEVTSLGSVSVSENTVISSSNINGDAGFVSIDSSGDVSVSNNSEINSSSVNGNAGLVEINSSGDISVSNSEISSSSTDGTAGSVEVTNLGSVSVSENAVISSSNINGDAGFVSIDSSGDVSVSNNSEINSSSVNGNAGLVEISSSGDVSVDNNASITSSSTNQTAGNILVDASNLRINGGQVESSTEGGVAGGVAINAATSVSITGNAADRDREGIFVEATNGGNAGSITLSTPQLMVTENAEIRASSSNRDTDPMDMVDSNGQAGFIEINSGTVELNRALISTSNENGPNAPGLGDIRFQDVSTFDATNSLVTSSTNSGFAGRITINAGQAAAQSVSFDGTIEDFNRNNTIDPGEGLGGAIATAEGDGSANDIIINTEALSLNNGASVEVNSRSNNADDTAGDITITSSTVTLNNNSQIAAETGAAGVGNPANIFLNNLTTLTTTNSLISSSTDSGEAGNIEITATESVTLGGMFINREGELVPGGAAVEAEAGGRAGDITITTPILTVQDGAQVSATTRGIEGGSVTVNSANVSLLGAGSGLRSETASAAAAGSLTVQPDQGDIIAINFTGGAEISASTNSAGQGGDLIINGREAIALRGNGRVRVSATSTGNAGELQLNTDQLILEDGVEISASTISSDGSPVSLVDLDQPLELINSRINASTQDGNAGSLIIRAPSILLRGIWQDENEQPILDDNGNFQAAGLFAEAIGTGNAGFISISTPGAFTIENGAQATISTASGDGKTLSIVAGSLELRNPVEEVRTNTGLFASSGSGQSGNITLSNLDLITIQGGSQLSAETESGGAGTININSFNPNAATGLPSDIAPSIDPEASVNTIIIQGDSSSLSAQATESGGEAGSVTLNAEVLIIDDQGELSASNIDSDRGGRILLDNLIFLQVSGGGTISSETQTGEAGDIEINAQGDRVLVDNGLISSSAATGNAGNIQVTAGTSVTLRNTAAPNEQLEQVGIQAIATQGGNAGTIAVNTERLRIMDEAAIAVSSERGTGTAGNITVDATTVAIRDGGRISAETDAGGSEENAANIRLDNLDTLRVIDGLISSSTEEGVAGSVTVNANESVLLRGTVTETGSNGNTQIVPGGIRAIATDGGDAGRVRVTTNNLTISDRAAIAVSSEQGDGLAGNIVVNAETVALRNNASISAETDGGGDANPANIRFNGIETLDVINSQISSATATGVAGSVRVNTEAAPANSVRLQGAFEVRRSNGSIGTQNGGIRAIATNGGDAGAIQVNTLDLTIDDRAAIAVSSRQGDGLAGDITINANAVTVQNNARISAETDEGGSRDSANIRLRNLDTLIVTNESEISASTNIGIAGNVNINSSDSVIVSDNSRIEVEAADIEKQGQGGIAGNLDINTGDLIVRGDSAISVSSPDGEAGNLTINAGFLNLNRGRLTAETGRGEDGSISITIDSDSDDPTGFLRLENESLISANATGEATGGNVTINSDFIFAFFPTGDEGSDIVANAEQGNGGEITIDTLGLFGIQFRPEQTPLNDITASSEGGAAGVVALNTPGIDPVRGFSVLPISFVDLSGLVGQTCAANLGAGSDRASSFTLTGQGGLPLSPADALGASVDGADWVTVEDAPPAHSLSFSLQPLPDVHHLAIAVPQTLAPHNSRFCYRASQSPST